MSDTGTGAAEQPAADLRSILSQAVTDQETAAEPAGEPKPSEAIPAPEKTERPAGERARGADGKFVAKEGDEEEPEAVETPEPGAAAEHEEHEEPEPAKLEEPPGADVPQHWSQADKELIAGLPKEAQPKVVERIKAMEAGFTPKLQRAAQIEKEFAPIIEMFAPHVEQLRARGQTPLHVIQAWAGVERDFQQGGAVAARRAAAIIKTYGVDPGDVAKVLMGEELAGAVPTSAPAPRDPQLQQEIAALRQKVEARDQAEFTSRQNAINQTIDSFISEKDATGALKHPFYSEVERDMEALARIDISQGKTPDVADLYDRAVYANRETRSKLLASQADEVRRKAAADRKAKAVAAQRAASSVTGSPGSGQSPTEQRQGHSSLRATIEAAVAEQDA